MIAALFDMDNTLLRVDTGMSWTKFLYRRGELPRSMLAKAMYWATLYKLAVLDMEEPFPRHALRAPRGKSGSAQKRVALPEGYLEDRDDDTPPRSPHDPAEIEAWEQALSSG